MTCNFECRCTHKYTDKPRLFTFGYNSSIPKDFKNASELIERPQSLINKIEILFGQKRNKKCDQNKKRAKQF